MKQQGKCSGISEYPRMDSTGQQWGKRYHRPAVRMLLFALMVADAATPNSRLVEAITHPGDILALIEVKLALNASSITNSTCVSSWDFTSDPCDSPTSAHFTCGIDCSAPISNISRITGLRLEPNAGYTGALSPAIGNLTALQHLTVSENAFHGHIPATLGNCRHLLHLDLSMNSFSGRLPESLSLLSSLTFLSVASNHLTGHLPPSLKNLTLLQVLDLRENHLTGTILYALPNLRTLNLSHNGFTAMEEFRITTLVKSELVSVDLSFNRIVGTLPASIAAMARLRVLALQSNMFTGAIPDSYALRAATSIAGYDRLQQLYLNENYLSGAIPRLLLNMSADGFSANLVRNCLQSCPPSLFFCKGGAQKSAPECKLPVALSG